MSHNTAALVASFQAAPPVPADSNERQGVDWVKGAVAMTLPETPAAVVGDVLMHCMSFLDAVIDSISEASPLLDWESRSIIARNVIGVLDGAVHRDGAGTVSAPKPPVAVEVGQIWADTDWRCTGRTVVVEAVTGGGEGDNDDPCYAHLRVLTDADMPWTSRSTIGRRSCVRLGPRGLRGYQLVTSTNDRRNGGGA